MSETTTTTTIPDFLLARIAEDEMFARAAESGTFMAWANVPDSEDPVGVHIQTWMPARVLAECEANRTIVAGFVQARQLADSLPGVDMVAVLAISAANALLAVLYALVSVYADHHDYRQEWRV